MAAVVISWWPSRREDAECPALHLTLARKKDPSMGPSRQGPAVSWGVSSLELCLQGRVYGAQGVCNLEKSLHPPW